ncbi:hypothetical protein PNEG_01590 [Pneumocystis murina B123]|uniref:Uncharacterized protein n=1 Tax=Pneumocystis murina (strain B123) TaxID=1069680 RepID=M7PIR0_PNEMU|nr:hypothetical protein PNEG_01590 [Pneumocystis murina B123]EMR10334.1 hypothetical protein PNEG_01590 [Pneumocystis murina B123]
MQCTDNKNSEDSLVKVFSEEIDLNKSEISKTLVDESEQKEIVDSAYDIVPLVDSLLEELVVERVINLKLFQRRFFLKMNKITEQLDTLEISINQMLAESREKEDLIVHK